MRERVEECGERVWVFDHWEMPAGYLDRLDPEQSPRDEAFPLRVEELVLAGVDQRGGDVWMLCERILPGR